MDKRKELSHGQVAGVALLYGYRMVRLEVRIIQNGHAVQEISCLTASRMWLETVS